MCETFFLEYSDEKGIVAWADADLYEGFTLPTNGDNTDSATEEKTTIKKGDYWKIYLGRRIVLDEDDYDGAHFIEGIIEDGILFNSLLESRVAGPAEGEDEDEDEDDEQEEKEEQDINKVVVWKTFLESPGIWATQPSFQPSDGKPLLILFLFILINQPGHRVRRTHC